MKKKLFFILTIFFTSNLFTSDTCLSCNVLSDSIAVLFCTSALYTAGYQTHKRTTYNFNDQNKCDKACAHCTGFIWTTYAVDRLTTQSCHHLILYTPITAHNIAKIAQEHFQEQFKESSFDTAYNRPKSSHME
jgi:hypothetical protein